MLMKSNGLALKVLMFIASPTMYLPVLLPIWITNVRIGNDCTSMVHVSWGKPN